MKIKIVALILVLVMMVPIFASCEIELDLSKLIPTEKEEIEDSPKEEGTDVIGDVTGFQPQPGTVSTETNISIPEPLPEEGIHNEYCDCPSYIDYGGKQFNFLAWKQDTLEYTGENPDEETSIFLYERENELEKTFGVELTFNVIPGNATSALEFVQVAKTSIKNNSGAYDAIAAYSRCAGILATYGMYENLNKVDSLELDNPWWPEGMIEPVTVADKLYYVTGDIATSFVYNLEFLALNADYAKELGTSASELQKLVLSGKWTIDKLLEVCDLGYADSDQQTGITDGDKFGLYVNSLSMLEMFYTGAGLSYVEEKSDGLYVSDDYTGSVSTDILTKLGDKLNKHDSYYVDVTPTVGIEKGNSLMYLVKGQDFMTIFPQATYTFALLPTPKASESQENYYTSVGLPISMYSIPIDAPDKEMSGYVLEAMACLSQPMWAKAKFKYYSNRSADSEIFDIIKSGARFDIAKIYFERLGGNTDSPVRVWRNIISTSVGKIGATVFDKSWIDSWNERLKDIYTELLEQK